MYLRISYYAAKIWNLELMLSPALLYRRLPTVYIVYCILYWNQAKMSQQNTVYLKEIGQLAFETVLCGL